MGKIINPRNEWFVDRARSLGFIVWPGPDGETLIAWPSEMIPEDDSEIHPRDLLASIKNQAKQKFPQIKNECVNTVDMGVV